MVKEKKQTLETNNPIITEVLKNDPEFLRIGDIQLASSSLPVNQLCGLALELLGNELVKEYLRGIETKKQMGTYYN